MTKISINFSIFTFFVFAKGYYLSHDVNQGVCETASCKAAGAAIKASIDPKVDPCDDFYEFSCGGWKKSNPIPEDKSKYERLDEINVKLQLIMKNEMTKSSVPSDAMSVQYAINYYKACTDEGVLEERGHLPLSRLLNRVGGWPILGHRSSYNESGYDWKTALIYSYAIVGQSAFYELTVDADANHTDVNILYLGVPEFGLGRNQLVNRNKNQEIVQAYNRYIHESAILLGAEESPQTKRQVEEMIDFESELAKASTKPEDMRQSDVWYNRMTFSDLNNLTEYRLNWLKFTQNIYNFYSNIKLKANDSVIVSDISYYKGTTLLLNNTPKHVIANYLGWSIIRKLGVFTTNKFRDMEFEFKKVSTGVQTSKPLWKYCIDSLERYLPFAYSRKFVDNHFESSAKDETKVIVKYLRKAMKIALNESDWLDEITKKRSIEKLNAMKELLGYPNWMLSNNELDNFYNLTKTVDKKKPFESLLYLKTKSLSNMFNKTYKDVNKTLIFPSFPAKVNAFYESTLNAITIPAGILSEPFFTNKVPAYINFGAIGQVIGHEFNHGFDDQGSEFDKNGNLVNWWTDCTKSIFKEKTKCFINRFSEINVSELNITLNGRNTVGEDMSDAGGLKQAYKAYKMYEKQLGTPQRLSLVNNYTPEQIFFISFSNLLCSNIRSEALKNQIEYDPHTPNKYRVNTQVSKFKKFTDAFNCKEGTKMNSGYICELW